MSLSFYIQDAQSLLFDSMGLFTPVNQLVRWINLGRRQCAQRSGCIQRMITGQSAFGAGAQPGGIIPGAAQPGALPNAFSLGGNTPSNSFQTIVGVERYPYQGFANPYLKAQHQGCKAIIDTLAVSVNWGSAVRPTLSWKPYIDLQAYARAYSTLVTSYPYYWSTFNDGENGEVWLFPVPSIPMEMEWQVYAVPNDLYSDDDYDAIPDGFKNAIKFYAAAMSFLGKRQFLNAQIYLNMFTDSIGVARVAVDSGKTPDFYYPVI